MVHEMGFDVTPDVRARMDEFFEKRIGKHLSRSEQREWFATYAMGIVGDGERKSVEPIAARATGNERDCKRMHDRLLWFVGQSPWDDVRVRREAAWYAIEALQQREPITTWGLDDTGFEKQGVESVGVQRQYTGSAGKIANCQLGVSLSVATSQDHVPIDFALYLPESWTENAARRRKARIPDGIVFKTKIELATDLITRAVEDKIPGEVVLVDAFYGASADFRNVIRLYGLDYGVAVRASNKVWLLDSDGQASDGPISVRDARAALGPKEFRRLTWRDGTRRKMHSRFCFRRVKVAADDGAKLDDREPVWLMIEWPEGEAAPTKFVLTSLPRRWSKKRIVRTVMERWRTERAYEDLKGELGLDHFEWSLLPRLASPGLRRSLLLCVHRR